MKERFFELNDFFNDMIKSKTNIIPIISEFDEDLVLTDDNIPTTLPLLPLRGNILFPKIILPVTAGRKKSIKLLNEAYKSGNYIAVVAQMNDAEEPVRKDLFDVGTAAKVIKTLELPDGLKHIGNGAFSGCAGLRNVHIPRSVRYIGHGAFINCTRLKDVWLYGDCMVEHDAFDDMPVLHFIDF